MRKVETCLSPSQYELTGSLGQAMRWLGHKVTHSTNRMIYITTVTPEEIVRQQPDESHCDCAQ